MNFSPNNVPLANNQQFGQSFDVKNIFRSYSLITDRNQVCFAKMSVCGVQEATLHLCPLGCLRNRQADLPRINMAHPKD